MISSNNAQATALAQPAYGRASSGYPALDLETDVLKDRHFERLAREIETRIGIKLPRNKKTMVEGRLRRRVRALGLASLDAYGHSLFDEGQWNSEFGAVVDCVTTNKTDFFREPEHFDILCKLVVPALLALDPKRSQGLRIWSAACSTGAEPYTLAMVLAALQAKHAFTFSILGTDINTEVLEKARRAVYPDDQRDPVPPAMRHAYTMDPIDSGRREFRIVPELRKLVTFSALNLMDESFNVEPGLHVVFCRNVLIYFEQTIQKAVVAQLVRRLRPSGFLFLGHSEAAAGNDHPGLRQVAPTVYQRRA